MARQDAGRLYWVKLLQTKPDLAGGIKNANEFKSGVVGSSEQSVRNYFQAIMKRTGSSFYR